MKKLLQILLMVSVSLGIFSCSKKVTTFNFGKPYHNENVNNVKTQEVKLADENILLEDEISTATTDKSLSNLKPAVINIESPKAKPLEVSNDPTISKEKQSFKAKSISKLIKKKIEKFQKKNEIDNKILLGIIIASIGVLLVILSVIGGPQGFVLFVLGLVGVLVGSLIILLAALDKI